MKNGEYELVIAPKDYPGNIYRNKYCYEHHLVWWENTEEIINDDEIIHHKDKNKRNNLFTNLEKLTLQEHNIKHGNGITMITLKCPNCGKIFKRERRQTHVVKRSKMSFCNSRCSGTFYGYKPSKEQIEIGIKENIIFK